MQANDNTLPLSPKVVIELKNGEKSFEVSNISKKKHDILASIKCRDIVKTYNTLQFKYLDQLC